MPKLPHPPLLVPLHKKVRDAQGYSSVKESLSELFASFVSFPTFLVQSMGYLPLSFDKRRNSFDFKFISFPVLSVALHFTYTFGWIGFSLWNLKSLLKLMGPDAPKQQGSSFKTVQLTYIGNMFLAVWGTCGIRISVLLKYKQILGFYDKLRNTVSSILLNSVRKGTRNKASEEVEVEVPYLDFLKWIQTLKMYSGEIRSIWLTIGVSLICNGYCIAVGAYVLVHNTDDLTDEYDRQGLAFKLFGCISFIVFSTISVLFSVFLIWIMKVVGFIRIGFLALQSQLELETSIDDFTYDYSEVSNLMKIKLALQKELSEEAPRGRIQLVPVEHFLRRFTELKDLVMEINDIFATPMMISLGGLSFYWIVYGFLGFAAWTIVDIIPFYGSIMILSLTCSMNCLCLSHFWSFCNVSHKLQEQANNCLCQLLKLDWDGFSLGMQQKMQLFYHHNLDNVVISPGKYFTLTRHTLTSVSAVLMTYVIVLLQFKSSE